MNRRTVLMAVLAGLLLVAMALPAVGCGGSGAEAAVQDFMDASKNKDCDKMVSYIDLEAPEFSGLGVTKEALVASCNDSMDLGEVVSYKIVNVTEDGDTATAEVEATTKTNGEESTDSTTFKLVKKDGEWKVGPSF
ncbi:lumazine-binding domain protein [bacterium BMS3Abin01]|nr:lumazine-binding domain protein [bacterium BMS3Abin01]